MKEILRLKDELTENGLCENETDDKSLYESKDNDSKESHESEENVSKVKRRITNNQRRATKSTIARRSPLKRKEWIGLDATFVILKIKVKFC